MTKEKRAYFIKKWRREHIALLVLLAAVFIGLFAAGLALDRPSICGLAAIAGVIEYAWQNNRMMIYVEEMLFGE